MKKLCHRSSSCVVFWGKKSSYQKHTHKILLKSLISHHIHGKRDEKVTLRYTFPSFLCPSFLSMWKYAYTKFSECNCFYIPYIFSFFYFWMLQLTDRFNPLNHQAYSKKKNIWSKCYLTVSNFLNKLVWLLPLLSEVWPSQIPL